MMTSYFRLPAAFALFGLCLGLGSARGAAADTKVFAGARILDGSGNVIEKAALVVHNGRFTGVGPSSKVKIPKGAITIDVTGKTIPPGLIDAHAHVSDVEGKGTGSTREK